MAFLSIKGEFFYTKWEQNYISKLHSMMTHFNVLIQRKHRKTKKTSFLKETVENADLHKAILNKTMTTQ